MLARAGRATPRLPRPRHRPRRAREGPPATRRRARHRRRAHLPHLARGLLAGRTSAPRRRCSAAVLDMAGDCRRGVGGGPLRRRRPLLRPAGRARWARPGSVLAVERDARACADARHNGAAFPNLRVLEAEVTPALVASALGRPDIVVLDPAREGAGTDVMRALGAHAAHRAHAHLRLVRPGVVRPRRPRPARRGLAAHRAARLRHLPHDRARRAGGGPAAAGPAGDRRLRRARRARARCARPTRTAASSAPRRSARTGTPADGRAPGPPRPC